MLDSSQNGRSPQEAAVPLLSDPSPINQDDEFAKFTPPVGSPASRSSRSGSLTIVTDGVIERNGSEDTLAPNSQSAVTDQLSPMGIDERPYSAFTHREKMLINAAASVTALFSSLSSFIFYPTIQSLAESLNEPVSKINISLTTYLIVAAISPSVVGDMADHIGRRPVYLFMLFVYVCSCIGLALQRQYPALLILRMFQSFGGSGELHSLPILCLI